MRGIIMRRSAWLTLIAFGLFSHSTPAQNTPEEPAQDLAQDTQTQNAKPALDEIVVSASRRDERLQDVPIAVTALGQDALEQREIGGASDLQNQVPGLVYAHIAGMSQITMRGVGTDLYSVAAEPGVAVYMDDVYMPRIFMSHAAMMELERIEVLRGPQGTLYGRNTSGGAIKFIAKKPAAEFEADAAYQIGAFEQWVARVSATGPLFSDSLRGRLSFYAEEMDGWTKNLHTGEYQDGRETLSGRLALDWAINEDIRLSFSGDIQQQDDSGPTLHGLTPVFATAFSNSLAIPFLSPFDEILGALESSLGFALDPIFEQLAQNGAGNYSDDGHEIYNDFPPRSEMETQGATLTAESDFDFGQLKLIGGWRYSERDFRYDTDGSDLPFLRFNPYYQDGEAISLEATFSAPADGRALNWIAGLYFFDEAANENTFVDILLLDNALLNQLGAAIPPQFPLLSNGGLAAIESFVTYDTRSYAAFGEADWQAADWVTFRLGGRITQDERAAHITWRTPDPTSSCENLIVEEDWTAFTGKAGIDFRFNEDVMAYGVYSQGFKSGGYNTTACDGEPFNPEYVDAFEVGLKSEWFDRRLRLNLAAFHYAYEDIQVQQINLVVTIIVNAAKATIKGAELEAQFALFDWLTLDGSATVLDARYDEYVDDEALTLLEGDVDLSGNYLPKSPEFASNLGVTALVPLFQDYLLTGRLEWSYKSQQFFTQFNNEANGQEAYNLFNAYVTLAAPDGGLGLQGFVKNFTDTEYKAGGVVASALVGGPVGFYAPPRTWGIEANYRF